jgi:preprotein translocase subunit SecY
VLAFFDLFRVKEIRNKIILTMILLAVYRLGFSIVLPVVDQDQLALKFKDQGDGGVDSALALMSILSASNVGMMTIFGLGIMPYISASIVFQLLATVYQPLELLQKEGEVGRRKINEYTRYTTVAVCFIQSLVWVRIFQGDSGSATGNSLVYSEFSSVYFQLISAMTMTAGSTLLMWIAEQIDEYGVGNGVSLIIMAGILGRVPQVLQAQLAPALKDGVAIGSESGLERFAVLACIFVTVVVCVVAVTQSQRRIPIRSARHVRGNQQFSSQQQYLPLRVNQSGVMPVIFASSLIVFPLMLLRSASAATTSFPLIHTAVNTVEMLVSDSSGLVYNLIYVALIYFFCYFWSAVTFNPVEVANNLRDYGSFVPGYRPGARTAVYLQSVISRLNFLGAAFLSILAVIPVLVMNSLNLDYLTASFFGGTGLLICISVVIDLVQKIDSILIASNRRTISGTNTN